MMTKTKLLITLGVVTLLATAALVAPASAEAQQARRIQTLRGDVHIDLGWFGGFGVGGRVDIPIIPDGVLTGSIEDEMSLSVGADLFFAYFYNRYSGDLVFLPQVVWQWSFYLNEDWSIFPELGLGIWFGNHGYHRHRHDTFQGDHMHVWPELVASFGARYHFDDRLALLMRISWPTGLQVGLVF